jgi:hypothetical protein
VERSKTRPVVIPHIVSKTQQGSGSDVSVGVDVRHSLSQTMSGFLTLNPDFSVVEADQEQVNLTRFELNLPEKRNFFIEGNDAYLQDIRLFYSRRISDIYGGLKVYGKTGSNEISVLTTQAKRNDDLAQSSGSVSAFRLKHDVMGSSSIGFIAAERISNGIRQGSFGFDTALYLTDRFKVSAQAAMSHGKAGKSDIGLFVKPSYDSTTLHAHIRYQHLGDRFGDNANAVGFIPDDNRREVDSSINKTFWVRNWNLDRIEYKSNYDIYWGMNNALRSWEITQAVRGDLRNKFSLELRRSWDFKLYEERFHNRSSALELGYNTRQWRSASVSYQFGRNFGSDFTLVSAQVKQNVTRTLSLQYTLARLAYSPDPQWRSTRIHVFVADQYFTKDLYLKCFYQTNSAIDKKNAQVVFAYRFQPPFGLVQIAYQYGSTRFGEAGAEGHTVFLKFAYVF